MVTKITVKLKTEKTNSQQDENELWPKHVRAACHHHLLLVQGTSFSPVDIQKKEK